METQAVRVTKEEGRVFAELALCVVATLDEDTLALVAPAVARAASELAPGAAPCGLLVDLAVMLLGPPVRLDLATGRVATGLPTDDPRLRAAILATFDSLLAPIAVSATLTDVRDALVRHPRAVAADVAGVLVSEILGRVLETPALDKAPRLADLRKALERHPRDIAERGAARLLSADRRAALTASYEAVARRARRTVSPLDPSDAVVARGAPHLRHRAARLALRQLADAQAAVAKQLPAAIPHRRARGTDVATRQHDESTYPMGGFSSMTNVGSLENVVTSELALSSDGDIGEDLFAIRWAMGELLYYMRDESVAHRRRVAIWVLAAPELATTARVKDPDAPWQRLVLAFASIAVFIDRVTTILRQEALTIRVVLPEAAGLEEERTLLRIRLADAIERGVVEIVDDPIARCPARIEEDARVADVMTIELGPTPALEGSIVISPGPRPTVRSKGAPLAQIEPSLDAVAAWAEVVKTLLLWLP